MKTRNSLRWRLPFSYAVIALVTALALAGMLLLALNNYYLEQERRYLLGNARTIGIAMQLAATYGLPSETVQAQAESLSFFTQTRVRLLDPQGNTVADSGSPLEQGALTLRYGENGSGVESARGNDWFFSSSGPVETGPGGTPAEEDRPFWLPDIFFGSGPAPEAGAITASIADEDVVFSFPAAGSFYGFYLDQTARPAARRSAEIMTVPIPDETGAVLGYVELSEGPAYAQEIVNDVAWGLVLASIVAVLLAAVVGWLMSRRISVPVVDLVETTTRMAGGDLSARASLDRADEIGLLSVSFNQMAARIESTVDTLRQFVSDAAHEIFTPITAARTQMELALQEPDDRSHLEQALEQLARLEALTANLLNLSRLETPEASVERERIALDQLLARIAEPFAAQAEQAGVNLGLESLDRSFAILANQKQIEQLIGNLLSNAVKFTPGGGDIRVALSAVDGFAQIVVEDTGIGIPDEDLPDLFKRFHRGRNTAGIPGSGLGLAISKAITENHGGHIWVEPVEMGTRFVVRLPFVEDLEQLQN